ncbi:MAG: His/Gly/Thr/Pro-type tRNA ligase C-terminal domain-containing protein, partial [Solirubrobacteraceae bacterium]
MGTIQLDGWMPQRLDATYTTSEDALERPFMIHRALFGSFERFIGILLEHLGGELPVWLSPVQAIILPITDGQNEAADAMRATLAAGGVRVVLDDRSESLDRKIRDAELQRIPYMLIVGAREAAADSVAVRERGAGDTGAVSLGDFLARVGEETATRSR